MAGLQRSALTFRRSGSSGIVWDERFLSEGLNQTEEDGEEGTEAREMRHSQSVGSIGMMKRSSCDDGKKTFRSDERRGDVGKQAFRAILVPPAADPPSPKVSGFNLCGFFKSPTTANRSKSRRH
ncbi:MAPK kinase substrate protein At1g80180 [Typha latifolia]|uniref:MAPK kinase substrate protein At1g80180 n=1 Tax=Typha latifolia TaxID=4733 RepID=UPI003C2B9AC0